MIGTPLITDCTFGELSPRLYGRVDQPVYYKGGSKFKNVMPKPQGGWRLVPGTCIVGRTNGDAYARLVELTVRSDCSYILEFSNNSIRYWKNDASGGAITGTSTYTAAEIPDLQFAWVYPDLFIAHRSHAPARIRWTTPDTLTLSTLTIKTASYAFTGTTTSGSAEVTAIAIDTENLTPLLGISGTGIPADTIINEVEVVQGTPDTIKLTLSKNSTGSATVALVATLLPVPFQSTGNYPGAVNAAFQRVFWGGSTYNPQSIWGTVVGIWDDLDADGALGYMSFKWADQVNYAVKQIKVDAYGYPTTNPPTYVSTPNCRQLITESSAMSGTIADTNETIMYISAARDLIIGTASGEWIMPGDATPDTMSFQLVSKEGSAFIQAAMLTGGLVMVKAGGRRVLRIDWQGSGNAYEQPEDLTFFSEHLFKTYAITQFEYVQSPEGMLLFLRSDGIVVAAVYSPKYGVTGWFTIEMTGATIESICVIPGSASDAILPDATRDTIYFSVLRGTSRYIEKMQTPDWSSQKQAVYMNAATYKYHATPFTTVAVNTGLNGTTMTVIADGARVGTADVIAGVVTIPGGITANYAVVGIPFNWRFQTMQIEAGADYNQGQSTGQMRIKNIAKVRVRFIASMYAKVGSTIVAAALDEVVFPGVTITAASPDQFTGDIVIPVKGLYNRDGYLNMTGDYPLPCEVTAIIPEVVVTE